VASARRKLNEVDLVAEQRLHAPITFTTDDNQQGMPLNIFRGRGRTEGGPLTTDYGPINLSPNVPGVEDEMGRKNGQCLSSLLADVNAGPRRTERLPSQEPSRS
jgi:hypothetical protein